MELPIYNGHALITNKENDRAEVSVITGIGDGALRFYGDYLQNEGYEKKEVRYGEGHVFEAYSKGTDGVFLNYFSAASELYIVTERDTRYFARPNADEGVRKVTTQLTQLKLEDYGMCYVIRLSDGRFIVIDSGRELAPDTKRLYNCLRSGTADEKPTIACWIITHPHSDHFHGFLSFYDSYGEDVVIQSFLYNFPNNDDTAHYPEMTWTDVRMDYDTSILANMPKMFERVEKSGAAVYSAHTGQTYHIGEAKLEILACMDDTIHLSTNVNAISTVIRMELCGQVILWGADASFGFAQLAEKYGKYLKSDILQVPHHGFGCGSADAEIKSYSLIQPEVALLPVSDFNAYTCFCIHRQGARFLIDRSGVSEIITGEAQRTIDLPYTASPSGKWENMEKRRIGLASCGANTYFFDNLSTDCPEDFEFSFTNTTHTKAVVWIEMFFAEGSKNIRAIKLEIPPLCRKAASIIGEEVNPEALYFNWMSLGKRGIPKGEEFSVRFRTEIPLLISHKKHSAAYHA